MLKITRLLDYGLLVAVTIAKNGAKPYSATQVTKVTGLNTPTVRKLLNQLCTSNIIASKRGVEGGYTLIKDSREITVLDVVKAVEKSINLTDCCDFQKKCSLENCATSNYWKTLNHRLLNILSETSIYDIVNKQNKGCELQMSENLDKIIKGEYQHGFVTNIEAETIKAGLDENVIRLISARKNEPEFLLNWRLKAYKKWLEMKSPSWSGLNYPRIDFQSISYYSSPKSVKDHPKSLDEVDPEIIDTYNKLGIPLHEQQMLAGVKNVAVDAVFDSVSVATTFKQKLAEAGVIFCPISEAIQKYPQFIEKYLGSVVPPTDNFFAALNSAVFSDGSFVYIPKGVNCPMELSTYFRINAINTGQFERTLIIAEENSYVSYLEGCTAPMRDENQLHAAVVELVALKGAQIKYSTVQNWYPGDKHGKGGIYNFVTKRGMCKGDRSKISWTQVETGSAITWKYPSVVLRGDNSVGEFYSVALTRNLQQADTGTKMIHIGKNTKSTIISKGISAAKASQAYRGLVRISPNASNTRNFSQCDSLLIGDSCSAHTYPYIENKSNSSLIEHEATTSKISDEQLFYCKQRGLSEEDAIALIVNGFCKEVFKKLPLEFAIEAQKLMEVSLEGAVG